MLPPKRVGKSEWQFPACDRNITFILQCVFYSHERQSKHWQRMHSEPVWVCVRQYDTLRTIHFRCYLCCRCRKYIRIATCNFMICMGNNERHEHHLWIKWYVQGNNSAKITVHTCEKCVAFHISTIHFAHMNINKCDALTQNMTHAHMPNAHKLNYAMMNRGDRNDFILAASIYLSLTRSLAFLMWALGRPFYGKLATFIWGIRCNEAAGRATSC